MRTAAGSAPRLELTLGARVQHDDVRIRHVIERLVQARTALWLDSQDQMTDNPHRIRPGIQFSARQ